MKDLRIENVNYNTASSDNKRSYLDINLSAEEMTFYDAQSLHDHVKGYPDTEKAKAPLLWRGQPILEAIEKIKEENDSLKDKLEALRKAEPTEDTVPRSLFDTAVKQRDERAAEVTALAKKVSELEEACRVATKLDTAVPAAPDLRGSKFEITQRFAEGFDPNRVATALVEGLKEIGESAVVPLTTKVTASSEADEVPDEEGQFRMNAMRKLADIKVPKEDARRAVVDAYYELKGDAARLNQKSWLGSQLKLTLADLQDVEPEMAGHLISAQIEADKEKAAQKETVAEPKPDLSPVMEAERNKFLVAFENEKRTAKSPKQKLIAAAMQTTAVDGKVSKSAVMNVLRSVRSALPADAVKDLDAMLVVGQDKQTMADKLFTVTATALKLKAVE